MFAPGGFGRSVDPRSVRPRNARFRSPTRGCVFAPATEEDRARAARRLAPRVVRAPRGTVGGLCRNAAGHGARLGLVRGCARRAPRRVASHARSAPLPRRPEAARTGLEARVADA